MVSRAMRLGSLPIGSLFVESVGEGFPTLSRWEELEVGFGRLWKSVKREKSCKNIYTTYSKGANVIFVKQTTAEL